MPFNAQVGDDQAIPESRVAHVENEIEVRAANIVSYIVQKELGEGLRTRLGGRGSENETRRERV